MIWQDTPTLQMVCVYMCSGKVAQPDDKTAYNSKETHSNVPPFSSVHHVTPLRRKQQNRNEAAEATIEQYQSLKDCSWELK
jgi:hypothetical protein